MPKTRTVPVAQPRAAKWWLGDDDADCPHCGLPYCNETERRCPDCDGPCCMHCATAAEHRGRCPECATAAGRHTAGRQTRSARR